MNYKKMLPTLLLAIVLSLLVIAIPATSALAQAPSISVHPTSGPVGTTVTVSGTKFTNGDTYSITFAYGTTFAQLVASGTVTDTTFTTTFSVPTVPRDSYTIQIVTTPGDFPRSFTVTPQITLGATSGAVGDTVTVSGTGFNASSTVTIYFDTASVGTATTNANGSFTNATFTVPESYRGSHMVKASDATGDSPDVTFTISPKITVTPTSGAVGDTVTVSGTGFNASSTVTIYFDTASVGTATTTANGSFTNATFTVPESYEGSHTVKASDATGDSPDVTFTILPAISREITVTPTSGAVGDTVIVSGTGFNASSTVTIYFDTASVGTATTDANGSFTNATFTVPESYEGSHTVKASDATGDSPDVTFTILPKITVNPTSGVVGDTVIVSGTGFNANSTVTIYFDTASVGTATTDANGSFTNATFTVPGSYEESHTVKAQDASGNSATVTFTIGQKITITPTTGAAGTTVTVSGTGFNANSTVTIYFDTASVSTATTDANGSFTNATFTVPGSYEESHTVKAQDASGNSATVTFTIGQKITITPTTGAAGTTVTVSGTGFNANSTVTIYFDTASVSTATTDTNGSFTNATFTVPGSYEESHTVKAQDASGNSATVTFTIGQKITITPTTGTSGTTVTVSGTGFKARKVITITFDVLAVTTSPPSITTDDYGSLSGSFPVPVIVNGTYEVKVTDGTNRASANFTVMAGASIDKTTGNVGTEATVSGTGFAVGATVTVTYDGDEVAIATADTNGACKATFKIPASEHGAHTIAATDGTNTKQFTFVMESEVPPIPPPLLPDEGIKAETEAYFDWQDVTDPSGVSYTLQIASDENFTGTSIVLEKEGLTDSEYTITEEEKLESASKKEPYYWRVKAIDGASNQSQWSDAWSFYVGFQRPEMKGWPLYALIGLGGLLLFISSFWLGRRIAYRSY